MTSNTVMEVDSEALPVSDDNPYGLDLVTNATPVRSEAEAARDYRWETQRSWKVVNPTRTNRHGTNTAYKLVPTACFPPMMDPATAQYLRAPVIGHTLWVTRHHDDERWPAGAHPTQSERDEGMTRWIADDEPLEGTDVVLWYVFGLHHITRIGGLADHACRHDLLLAQAVRVLRPEPVDRRGAVRHGRRRPLPHGRR